MKVDDLLDLGFINDKQDYTDESAFNIKDITNNNIPEFTFRIRTNEPFRLSIQTSSEDSSGNPIADSVLQVKLLAKDNADKNTDDYKNVTKSPTTLINNSSEEENKTFTVKYRPKPGANMPPEVKKLNIIFTASYP